MVSKEDIRHLAWLSRIDLSDTELETYSTQIGHIMNYFDRLDAATIDGETSKESRLEVSYLSLRNDEPSPFPTDPLGTKYRKDGFVKGPRMT
jgi:aspartyl-tRNA(Asn)/glutamyl-tRNA(Gln) amidotransferase subunit C